MTALGGITLLAFDVYGTLFDVQSVTASAEAMFPGHGTALSQLWRAKQLEYTWLQGLMGRRTDFATVTRSALEYAAEARGLSLDAQRREALVEEYLRLTPFPEARAALAALAGTRKVILSNGTATMLETLVRHAGLDGHFEAIISVDEVDAYKPSPRVYARVQTRTGVPPDRTALVSANGWDAVGARAFGLASLWVNRAGGPLDRHGPPPSAVVRSLVEIAPLLSGSR